MDPILKRPVVRDHWVGILQPAKLIEVAP